MATYEETLKWWKEKNIRNDAELAQVLDNYRVLFSYNSGKIENDNITYHDTREIFDHDGVTSYTGDLRTLFEIRNSKEAYEYFLECFHICASVDLQLLCQMQYKLTQHTYDTRRWQTGERSGEFKKHDYVTGRNETGAAAEDVKEELQELLDELVDIPEEKALIAAAYFHVKFENIHPFADGNGRTGRLAMNYFLVQHNHPPITIFEEDRTEYYSALECWDQEQDLNSMISFLQGQTSKTWSRQIDKVVKLDMKLLEIIGKVEVEEELDEEFEL